MCENVSKHDWQRAHATSVEEFHTDLSCVLIYVKSNYFDIDNCYLKVGAAYDIPNVAI
jgi:hypothetical protein